MEMVWAFHSRMRRTHSGIFGIIQSQIQLQAMLPYIRKDLGLDNTKK